MVGGTSFPLQDSKSEPWSNEQKTKATPKPSPKGKAKPEARTLADRGIATGALEVSLDNADTVIDGVARPIAKRRAGILCLPCRFSKGGMLTFAYRSKFFANSYFRASRPTFFITHFLYPHH